MNAERRNGAREPIRLSDHFSYGRLIRFTMPTIIMMIFTSIYSVVDGLFVSNAVGKTEFAALNFIFPFIMVLGGAGFMIGTGGTAQVAQQLGRGNKEKANRYFSMMVCFTVLLGILLAAIGIAVIRPVCVLLGATPEMMEGCVLYGRIVIAFTPAFMLQNVFQSFLAAAEKPKLGLFVTVAAGLTNAALDALFIVGFRWGLAGAALATGLGQVVGGVLPLIYFLRPNNSLLRLTGKPTLEAKPILKACGNGSSEMMSNIASSLVGMLYNFQLLKYIGEDGVSAYGVLMYVQFIFIAISIGYSIGVSPIVSYHYGAENTAEMKSLLRKSITLTLTVGVALTALAIAAAGPFAYIFVGFDGSLFALTKHAFRLFSFSFLLAGFNIFCSGFFTALGNGGISALISFLRVLVFQASSVIVLPLILDIDGIWWAITVSEVMAAIISAAFLLAKRQQYHY